MTTQKVFNICVVVLAINATFFSLVMAIDVIREWF